MKIEFCKCNVLRCDRGSTGNRTVTDLRLFSSRGYSLHDGVTRYEGNATYYWSPVSIFTMLTPTGLQVDSSIVVVAMNAFEYNSVVWSPCLKCEIEEIEKVQRYFNKRLKGLKNVS